MSTLQLSMEEKEALIETLKATLSDLGFEIADTDSPFFKEQLWAKKKVLNKILDSLESADRS